MTERVAEDGSLELLLDQVASPFKGERDAGYTRRGWWRRWFAGPGRTRRGDQSKAVRLVDIASERAGKRASVVLGAVYRLGLRRGEPGDQARQQEPSHVDQRAYAPAERLRERTEQNHACESARMRLASAP